MSLDTNNETVSRFAVVREMDADELVQEAQNLVKEAEKAGGYEEYLLISQCAHSYRQLTGAPLFVDTRNYGSIDWLTFHSMQPQGSQWLTR
jgi:hypothetical protein